MTTSTHSNVTLDALIAAAVSVRDAQREADERRKAEERAKQRAEAIDIFTQALAEDIGRDLFDALSMQIKLDDGVDYPYVTSVNARFTFDTEEWHLRLAPSHEWMLYEPASAYPTYYAGNFRDALLCSLGDRQRERAAMAKGWDAASERELDHERMHEASNERQSTDDDLNVPF